MPDPAGAAAARSYLYVPGDRPDRLAGALTRGADALIIDLGDSVARAAKDQARQLVVGWLAGQQPAGSGPRGQLWLRINSDLAAADIGAVSAAVTGVVVPKAEPALLAAVAGLLAAREQQAGLDHGRLRVLPLVETAAGLLQVTILAAAPRVIRLGIGEADLAAELGLRPGPGREELAPIRLARSAREVLARGQAAGGPAQDAAAGASG
ncbi:MAG TPA: aldolase/citrate lyase family protein [Streptosporangiaceae bacterium]